MPQTDVFIFKDDDGSAPLLDWLDEQPAKVKDALTARVELLAQEGNQLRRPHCDKLDSGIFELRKKVNGVNYRILYGFCGKCAALLSHGCTKEQKVPPKEIKKAKENLDKFKQNPAKHTYYGEL